MSGQVISVELRTEFEGIAEECGCELLHGEFVGGRLKLVLDHSEGVTLEHCEQVSRQASALLDVMDFGPGKYTLEVTSPGLDRKFYRQEDYKRFCGQRVRVTWRESDSGQKQTTVGHLQHFDSARGGIQLEGDTGTRLEIQLADIEVTKLEPDFGK